MSILNISRCCESIYPRKLQWVILIAAGCLVVPSRLLVASENESTRTRPLHVKNANASISQATIRGPQFYAPSAFYGFETYDSPRIKRLREEYRLREVVQGEEDEFRQILLLRHWVHTRWPIDNNQNFSGGVFAILEKARAGDGFHCSHSMRVQHAVITSMGFVARDLGIDRNHKEFGSGHHGVNEVWSNQFTKWVLLDAKYDIHFERNEIPISALELHEAVRSGRTDDIVKVQGPDRKVVPMKGFGFPESSVLSYWWVSYHVTLDRFTGQTRDSRLVIFDNAAFRETTWFRGSSERLMKHWAYAAKAFIPTKNRHQIDWTPGVPDLELRQVSERELDVTIRSVTPNLKTYQLRSNHGAWQASPKGDFRWLLKPGENSLDVHSQNYFGVNGPTVTATVLFSPGSESQ